MQRDRPPQDPPATTSADEPALLRPPANQRPPGKRSERNDRGYQETPVNPSTSEADREASDNCALLHRARKREDEGFAAAESSPGSPVADHRRDTSERHRR